MQIQKRDFVFYLFLFVGLIVFLILIGVYTAKHKGWYGTTNELTPIVQQEEWKTYRNEEYGFEFKYPADLGDPEPNMHGIVAFRLYDRNKPNAILEKGLFVAQYFNNPLQDNDKKININGYEAIAREVYGERVSISFIQPGEEKIINLTYDVANPSYLKEKEDVINKIASTFKFTN